MPEPAGREGGVASNGFVGGASSPWPGTAPGSATMFAPTAAPPVVGTPVVGVDMGRTKVLFSLTTSRQSVGDLMALSQHGYMLVGL